MSKEKDRRRRPAPGESLNGLEFEARRQTRLATVSGLQPGRTPLDIITVAEHAAEIAEHSVRQAHGRNPPYLACAEGCAWCCHKIVGTAAPEVLRIAAFLRQRLPDDLAALRQRTIERDEQRRALRHDRWAAARVPCPLLVEERCSVYPIRPLTCRGYNSRDARPCKQAVTERSAVTIPIDTSQLTLATFVLDGLRAGAAERGLGGELLELTAALRIALTTPDAAERWLAGEPLFKPARLP